MTHQIPPTTANPNRERFIQAARTRFANQGFAATTTRQIVADVDSSMGNLYFYFKGKEAIFRAVLEDAIRATARQLDAAIIQAPPGPAQLAIAVIAGVETLGAERDLARIIFVEAPQSGLRAEALAPFVNRVQSFFESTPSLLEGPSADIAANAWVGGIWQAAESRLTASTEPIPRQLGIDLARWNLRAIGLSSESVDRAVQDALTTLDRMANATMARHFEPARNPRP